MSLRIGELCAGTGVAAHALEAVFYAEVAWFSEYDKDPSKVLAYHYPGITNYGDMTKIDWAACPPIDLLSGGTPCQDLSHAGKRGGMTTGTRSNLWVNMREAIATLQPEWVWWENVRGAYSAKADSDLEPCPRCMGDSGDTEPDLRALGRVLGDLSELGYDAEWRGLRASEVGAPHGRYRVFVLARRRDARHTYSQDAQGRFRRRDETLRGPAEPGQAGSPGPTPANPAGGRGPQTIQHDGSQPAPADGTGIPDQPDRNAHGLGPDRGKGSTNTNGGDDSGREPDQIRGEVRGETTQRSSGRTNGTKAAAHGDYLRNDRIRAWTPEAGWPEPENSNRDIDWQEYERAIRRWEYILGRPAARPTEPSGRAGREQTSPRFTEWMMGWPEGWVTDPAIGISRSAQIKCAGNGVVPQQQYAACIDMIPHLI